MVKDLLPSGFRFGVATAGFQIEGGYNGPGEEPRNNWYEWEAAGRVEPSGIALDFWNHYEEQLDRVAGLGCNTFRLSVEWARCEPTEGELDDEAFSHYRAILDACHARGLEPLVTLHHFTHPAWLGEDLWTSSEAPARFAAHAESVVARLGGRCTNWVTINEPNVLVLASYLTGTFPPGRFADFAGVARALDHMAAGHVLAYEALHAAQPAATVSINTFSSSIYELEHLLVDVLLARSHGVGQEDLDGWLADRRRAFYASDAGRGSLSPEGRPTRRWPRAESVLRSVAAKTIPLGKALPRAVDAVYAGAHERPLDVVQIDYYDPEIASHLQPPLMPTAGGRVAGIDRPLWEDPPCPAGMVAHLAASEERGLDLWVVENGICNRVRRGRSHDRRDGWTRTRYLRANLEAVVEAVERGLPVSGYWHWCLADNYEWGSYEPRFGLYGVDRERGARWSEHDSMGEDAAGTYRALIEGLRAGDRSGLQAEAL
jgi:beta-glucosidase